MDKKERIVLALLLALVILVPTSVWVGYEFAVRGGAAIDDLTYGPGDVDAFSYVVFKDGSNYYAKNGTTRIVDYGPSTNPSTILQSVVDSGGSSILVKKCAISISTPIQITTSNLELVSDGATITADGSSWNAWDAVFEITASNITIAGFNFVVNTHGAAIVTTGGSNQKITNNHFTGTTDRGYGMLAWDGFHASMNMHDIWIENNIFEDMASGAATIYVYPQGGHIVENLNIENNIFRNLRGIAIDLDSYDTLNGTIIRGNQFIDLYGEAPGLVYGVAVWGFGGVGYQTQNLIVSDNYYKTDSVPPSQVGFVMLYFVNNTIIENNIAIAPLNAYGPAIALGRVAAPAQNIKIASNTIYGFDAFWDPDSMINVEVFGNTYYGNSSELTLGYGIQEYIHIHDNTFHMRPNAAYPAAIMLGNSNPKFSIIENNIIINDWATPVLQYIIETTGTFNFSDVILRSNYIYAPYASTTFLYEEFGASTQPVFIQDFFVENSTGRYYISTYP